MVTKYTKVDKYIYYFLKYLEKEDLWTSCSYLQHKYKLKENYSYSIVEECVNSKYVDGIFVQSNANNRKHIMPQANVFITRNGYNFMHNYNQSKINLFWIPFKNLIIIAITALITAIVTTFINNKVSNKSYFQELPQNQYYQDTTEAPKQEPALPLLLCDIV